MNAYNMALVAELTEYIEIGLKWTDCKPILVHTPQSIHYLSLLL